MLDQIEYRIAQKLAEYHLYPYAKDIYLNIFKKFSHFPLNMRDIGMRGEGKTITFLALVVSKCLAQKHPNFSDLYTAVLKELSEKAAKFFPQDISVETFIGCVLFYYHPSQVKNTLSTIEVSKYLNKDQLYEFELKKKTILIFTV